MYAPTYARVLIQRDRVKTSLILPDNAAERNAPVMGKVISKGPTADESIEIGQHVIFGRHAGTWLKEAGDDLYLVQDEDILAVRHD